MTKIRVLVIDDSAIARRVIKAALARDPQIEVVGDAPDAYTGRHELSRLNIDVVTLDLEMPKIDGLMFIRAMLPVRPLPIVVVSAFTAKGSALALRALEMGAVEVMQKPDRSLDQVGDEFAVELVDKVKAAARAKAHVRLRVQPTSYVAARPRLSEPAPARVPCQGEPVILLGASTGGVDAIPRVLARMPRDAPPIVCVQHIPALLSRSFAERIDGIGGLRVSEARAGDALESGHVYVAPGGRHLVILGGSKPVLHPRDGPLVNRHRPSIDVTFRSAAERLGRRVVAALLTGMGDDGVDGLGAIHTAGGFTLAQDEATSIVYGMPQEAARRGAVHVVAPLDEIAGILVAEAGRRAQA
jgi:two-component system chemotaxis response regulator CheB